MDKDEQSKDERDHGCKKASIDFTTLKATIAKPPTLRHFDPDRPPVIVVYACKWVVSAALIQE